MALAEVGRLALREEGEFWSAYWCPFKDTMDGALALGQIRLSLVGEAGSPVYVAFVALQRLAFEKVCQDVMGQTPTWGATRPAPENEREGHTHEH